MPLYSYVFHVYFVFLNIHDLLDGFPYVEHAHIFDEVFLLLVQDSVVQDVVDEEINELGSRKDLLPTAMHSVEDLFEGVDGLFFDILALQEFYELGKIFEVILHGLNLANERVERVPQLMRNGRID